MLFSFDDSFSSTHSESSSNYSGRGMHDLSIANPTSVRFGAGRGENFAPCTTPQRAGPRTGNGTGNQLRGPTRCTATGPHRYLRCPGFFLQGTGRSEKKKDPPPRPAVRCGAGIFRGAPRALKRTLNPTTIIINSFLRD